VRIVLLLLAYRGCCEDVSYTVDGAWCVCSGQSPADADLCLLDIARKIEHYGLRLYPAKVNDHHIVSVVLLADFNVFLCVLIFNFYLLHFLEKWLQSEFADVCIFSNLTMVELISHQ